MDRLNQLRGKAGTSRDSTLDTTSPPSEAYMTANESSSKYFSLSEVDTTFDISPIKDVSSTIETERTITEPDRLISNLSPIGKKNDFLDSYKIGKQIEAANILSGGVDIFDDNDNSYDGDELVIDDNVEGEEKSIPEIKIPESKIKQDIPIEATLVESEPLPKKDSTEVTLQIDGKNVDAIDIGNGLYLYRREGEEELAAVQIDGNQQQSNFKFLKVRENDEGNLEVYEEIQIEVPKEVPAQEGSSSDATASHVPIRDINDVTNNKVTERKNKTETETLPTVNNIDKESNEDNLNLEANGKLIKICESRKSPVVGSYTSMTYHSTPNKEGIPLTKTMVDLQLHPNRHSDNVKKTIEVHTDSGKPKVDKVIKENDDKIFKPDKKQGDSDQKEELKTKHVLAEHSHKTVEKTNTDENVVAEQSYKTVEKTNTDENVIANERVEKEEIMCEHVEKKETRIEESCKSHETENLNKPDVSKSTEDEPKIIDNLSQSILDTSKHNEDGQTIETKSTDKLDSEVILKKPNLLRSDSEIEESKEINKRQCMNEEKVLSTEIHHSKSDIDTITLQTENQSGEKVSTINESEKYIKDTAEVLVKKTDNVSESQHITDFATKEENNKIPNKENVTIGSLDLKDKCTSNSVKIEMDNKIQNLENIEKSVLPDMQIKISVPGNSNKDNTSLTNVQPKIDINKSQNLLQTSDSKNIKLEKNTNTKIDRPLSTETKESLINMDSTTIKETETKILVSSELSPKEQSSILDNSNKKELCNKDSKSLLDKTIILNKEIAIVKKTLPKVSTITEQKPASTNNVAVPFGKWTEANRQAFLNRIKETKVPSNSSNGKQIKNSNDLNRRDVLKKIDSHRQTHTIAASVKVQDFGSSNRLPIKKEASVFSSKSITQDIKAPVKTEITLLKSNPVIAKKVVKQESIPKLQNNLIKITNESTTKKELSQRKEINNQDLIDKTIEDIINRAIPVKSQPDNNQDVMNETLDALQNKDKFDEIEKRMNELHGFESVAPSDDAGAHRADQKIFLKSDNQKLSNKQSKIPSLLPFGNKNQRKGVKENIIDIDSEEEIIEHEPITGDMELNKKIITKLPVSGNQETTAHTTTDTQKDAIITEKDFDKFVRRNSISYENCITVNFDGKEPHNVVQTVIQKESVLKTYSKREFLHYGNKPASPIKHETYKSSTHSNQNTSKIRIIHNEEIINKNYHSKVNMAYQNAITAKRQSERPITIIEDKPVKVVFMDSGAEFNPKQLNAYGKDLSPAKSQPSSIEGSTISTSDLLDSDTFDSMDDGKSQDDIKLKTKHQRKQVLTPVETPELELIEPGDLGLEVSPKKKRKTEEKAEKSSKALVPKKSYLLGRGAILEDAGSKPYELPNIFEKEPSKVDNNHVTHKNTASAIDNLVKAAELLDTQSENLNTTTIEIQNCGNQQITPIKRGRGRPRKYPLPEGTIDKSKTPSPQKKPRLSEVKLTKNIYTDDDDDGDDDDENSDGEIITENWTMGKINENIVCPICNKLFRSENVVFKHVKHCTGPSPNRSDSGSKSPRRFRESQDHESSNSKLHEIDEDYNENSRQQIRNKRKSRDTNPKFMANKEDVIIITDTPIKIKPDKLEGMKHVISKKSTINKSKSSDKVNNLLCHFCGKTFRQLSYLVNHKLQHEKDDSKKFESDKTKSVKSVFSCEVCKKEFRKLHHLVQHRFIHNTVSVSSTKLPRKNSAEHNDNRAPKDQNVPKQNDDTSAGFRCEPCDKSFRKLHHLVEHRETHDGINRQKNTTNVLASTDKVPPPPQCEICKKTFRKIHHLIEHKEQHLETSSEKSDDRKSSLSTKDIIHECPLCYMVFPNEHSLNKHTIICQRKKRQSASKQNKQTQELENIDENKLITNPNEELKKNNDVIIVSAEVITSKKDIQSDSLEETLENNIDETDVVNSAITNAVGVSTESPKPNITIDKPKDHAIEVSNIPEQEVIKIISDNPNNTNKQHASNNKPEIKESVKKVFSKEKIAPTITKRHKPNLPLTIVETTETTDEDDDDDGVRYMLNPDYKMDDNVEGKLFMKVRAKKRNSLQIERPNSKDLVKRRISLQHPPKLPRLKPKSIQSKTVSTNSLTKNITKIAKLDTIHFTDSDDSDVKYSFPKTVPDKVAKSNVEESKEPKKKMQRKSLAEKRKSLNSIAKRKSLGKAVGAKHKSKPSPLKPIKKRSVQVEHRCDCGQLFSSAALLSRHTTLAHTPPRIRRRRRSPSPDNTTIPKQLGQCKSTTAIPKSEVSASRKSSVKIDSTNSNASRQTASRKSSGQKAEYKTPNARKSLKTKESPKGGVTINSKLRRAHKGVPVPDKMKKLMEKFKSNSPL
ncbi:unnamed protein product [Diatraea saccharalis]|uniref:C2H2-type domain-containing protein n=1 Tax=Diatraea saccharalis TaxID=40085 RepID=A0A9N9RE86_9NEOP|nr:unnamed protein product [Diatraea saccharalis]